MDPKHAGEMLKHLDKQHELLVDARQSMLDELHKYQIEEEMLMRKLHEVMSAHTKKKEGAQPTSTNGEVGALVCTISNGEFADSSLRQAAATPASGVKNPITYTRRKKK